MRDPAFGRLIAAGVDGRTAYEVVHSRELLAEKKSVYADYRKARKEMKELLTAKANINRILELGKEQEKANERREKEAAQR